MAERLQKLSELLTEHKNTLSRLAVELGVPSTHVDNRLDALHTSLCSTVDSQRREAEAEVELVRNKVRSVQKSINGMRNALGDAAEELLDPKESLLAALARLEKVQIDLSTSHTARLAQFANIYERFGAVLPILGTAFLAPCFAIPAADATEPPSDLRIATLSALERELNRCQEELDRRTQELQEHLAGCLALWTELGICPTLDAECRSAEAEFDQLMLKHLLKDDPTVLDPTLENLSRADTAKTWVEEEKKRREQLIQEVYEELFNLWVKLGVSDDEQDIFLERWKGIEQHSIDAYLAEKDRMLQLKAENMVVFIQRERDDIVRLEKEIYLSEEEQDEWQSQHAHLDGDDLLEAYEARRKYLMAELERRAPVLIPLNRYEALQQEVRELAESSKDQTRFKSRGDPGRLLREEKMRKRHAKEKPKLEAELLSAIPKWEEEHGQMFMIRGERYYDELVEIAAPKKSTIPPRSKTPVGGERAKTPAPGERGNIPASAARDGTATARLVPTTAKRTGAAASVAATPLAAKRPRGNTASEIRPLAPSNGNGAYSAMKPPSRPASRAGGKIPQLVFNPSASRQVSRDYKPRPSLTSLSSVTSVDSLFSRRTASTAMTDAYKDDE